MCPWGCFSVPLMQILFYVYFVHDCDLFFFFKLEISWQPYLNQCNLDQEGTKDEYMNAVNCW